MLGTHIYTHWPGQLISILSQIFWTCIPIYFKQNIINTLDSHNFLSKNYINDLYLFKIMPSFQIINNSILWTESIVLWYVKKSEENIPHQKVMEVSIFVSWGDLKKSAPRGSVTLLSELFLPLVFSIVDS